MPRGVPGPVKRTIGSEKETKEKKDPRFEGTNLPGPGPGRPKGVPNKFNQNLREAILAGINGAHPEGISGFVLQLAEANPTAAAALLGRFVPIQTENGKAGDFSNKTEAELREIVARGARALRASSAGIIAKDGEDSAESAGRLN